MSATAPLRRHPVLFGLLAFFVLLVIAVGVCEWRGWPFLRGPMERTLASKLDRDVRVGQGFSLHLLRSVRLFTDTLHLGPPRWAAEE
jgi:DMSO reductase anchor subunit